MNALRLRLRDAPGPSGSPPGAGAGVRVDLRAVTPAVLCLLGADDAGRFMVTQGNRQVALGELFRITIEQRDMDTPALILEGDLAGMDRIGFRMGEGVLHVEGSAGDYVGCGMSGGMLSVSGDAGDFAASELSGGRVDIGGDCGDFAAASLPGSIDGMRGGSLTIRGHAGARLADRMRRGTVIVFGSAGLYAASRIVAGTLAIAGDCAGHLGYGMRRGTVLCLRSHPAASSTFVATHHDIGVYWSLLRRHLAPAGGPFAQLPVSAPQRFVGDLAADGKGELLWFD